MSWKRWTNRAEEPVDWEALDPAMKQALGDFKASLRQWSESAYNRQRPVRSAVVDRSWRLAAGWSLSALLIAGTVSGGLYDRHRMQVTRQVAERAAEQQRQLAAQHAQEITVQEEDMLASIDGEVSREVPSAMEPLAQLPDEAESQ
jgi:hypothetical protein